MKIGPLDSQRQTIIIAEIGNCHEGDIDLAVKMIELAAHAGADAVKFQTIVPERLVAASLTDRLDQLRSFQLSYDAFAYLKTVADKNGVVFLSTPFDIDSARFLAPLVPAFKIASPDNNFYPLLSAIADTGKPILLSSGLSGVDVLKRSRDYIRSIWRSRGICQDLSIMHCVSAYPTPKDEANLRAIRTIKSLNVVPGYSDHTIGIEAAVLSVAVGARIIEKHFTVANDYSDFRDHRLSANPDLFASMVHRIREAERMLGPGGKTIQTCEHCGVEPARRSVAAARNLAPGCRIQWNDITWLRPGTGIAPGEENRVLNKKVLRKICRGQLILENDLFDTREGED